MGLRFESLVDSKTMRFSRIGNHITSFQYEKIVAKRRNSQSLHSQRMSPSVQQHQWRLSFAEGSTNSSVNTYKRVSGSGLTGQSPLPMMSKWGFVRSKISGGAGWRGQKTAPLLAFGVPGDVGVSWRASNSGAGCRGRKPSAFGARRSRRFLEDVAKSFAIKTRHPLEHRYR
jgi:hypothetical protein